MPAVPSFFLAFSAVFMFALYYSRATVRTNYYHSITLFENDFLMFGEMQNPPIVITDQPIPTPVPSVEIATKYNLMEETFGENWAKEPADKYLAPSYCTIGN
jgi:hypothetical protein